MLAWLKARSRIRRKAEKLYGAVVAAARTPEFYSVFRVPDTPEGRFEMVSLVLFLLLEPAKQIGAEGEALARGAIEAFVADMDDCLREMGVGDLTVPKKVRRAAAAFYERAHAYRAALGTGTEAAVADCLERFVWRGAGPGTEVALAKRVHALASGLASAGPDAILSGEALSRVAALLSERDRDRAATNGIRP